MDFELDTEQIALRDAVRGLLATSYSSIDGRRAATAKDPGFDEGMWQRLAEMGVLGLPFSEEAGGMGAGPVEVGLVAGELGRVLAPEPFVEAVVLAGGLLAATGADVSGVAEGTVVPAFAHHGLVHAVRSADGWVLDGVKEPVLNGARADVLVVTALVDEQWALFTVPGAEAERTSYATFEGGRASRVTFTATPATPLGDPTVDAKPLIDRAIAEAQVAYAHEAVGAMSTALTMTSEYLKTRKQFGVPIGAFQALQHRIVDMFIELEQARSMASLACAAMAGDSPARGRTVAAAKLRICDAAERVSKESVQLHGGMGMTEELKVSHTFRRLTMIGQTFGDTEHHLERFAVAGRP